MKNKIHKTAEISNLSSIGKNTYIWNNAQIRENVKIGKNCVISKDVYIDKNVKIGNNCKIQNAVQIYDGVTIKDTKYNKISSRCTKCKYIFQAKSYFSKWCGGRIWKQN